jgi:phosphodiesterase/alkaline phosphatase D-like protein
MKRWLTATGVVAITVAALTGVALAASSPAVTTRAASSIKQESAVLNGTINPNGAPTSYFFQWGLTTGYGATGALRSAGSGTKAVNVKETASGLIPGTTYHYRLLATNKFGSAAGADHTFKTAGHAPPGVSTGPTPSVSQNAATVTGVINPNGQSTSWTFQWGISTSYGSSTFGGTVPAGSSPVTVSQTLQGLAPGTIFHYRLVGSHGGNATSFGADNYFMTYPSHRPTPRVTRRVTPLHARARHQPWTYTVSGSVGHPASTPPQFACTGFVGVRFFTGGKRVNFALAPLQSNCTYSTQVVFHRKPGRGPRGRIVTMHVLVHYRGNGYLAPSDGRKQTVTLG